MNLQLGSNQGFDSNQLVRRKVFELHIAFLDALEQIPPALFGNERGFFLMALRLNAFKIFSHRANKVLITVVDQRCHFSPTLGKGLSCGFSPLRRSMRLKP